MSSILLAPNKDSNLDQSVQFLVSSSSIKSAGTPAASENDGQELDHPYPRVGNRSFDLSKIQQAVEQIDSMRELSDKDAKNTVSSENVNVFNSDDDFNAYRKGDDDLILPLEPLSSATKIVPWGKFRGMVDDRPLRCRHRHRNTIGVCYCCTKPIVLSRLRYSITSEATAGTRLKHLTKKGSFSNLSLQFVYGDENLHYTLDQENESRGFSSNYASSFRRRLHYYKELNGTKLRSHFTYNRSPNTIV